MSFLPLASKAGASMSAPTAAQHCCSGKHASRTGGRAAHGATVAEIDIVLTRDDRLVVLHDEILDRTTDGNGRVAALDLAEVKRLDAGAWFSPTFAGTRVPALEEALATARLNKMGLLIEIKERQRPEILIECLAGLLTAENALADVLVISFDHVSLLRLKGRLPAIRTELITHARMRVPWRWPSGPGRRRSQSNGTCSTRMINRPARGGHRRARDDSTPEVLALRRQYVFDDESA